MENIIKEIHDSNIFGCFIELGCGVPVASALLNVSGASQTVFMSESPYSKHYADSKYRNGEFRAVSAENVRQIMRTTVIHCNTAMPRDGFTGVNTVYVSSFQVGPGLVTHGWIGLHCCGYRKFYHVTIHEELTRLEYIERIKENGLKILRSKNLSIPKDCDIDIVLNDDLSVNNELSLLFLLASSRNVCLNFTVNGLARLEDTFRDKDYITLYKGSFNPPTVEHVRIADEVKQLNSNNAFSFMISVQTVDKGLVEPESVLNRVKWLNMLGFNVVVNKQGMFQDAVDLFSSKFKSKLVFPVGMDTYERLERDSFDFSQNNVHILSYPRTEISSTMARGYIMESDFEKLNDIVPTIIAEDIISSGITI
jgi:nicotinic acid mononucleotide adenylyltransferase